MQLIRKSAQVYVAEQDIATIGHDEINLLKQAVAESPLGRVRVNLHPTSDDLLHEMFIVIQKGSYVRPHKHPSKSEAFHMVHGAAQVVIFNDNGEIKQVVDLAANSIQTPFYYRMSKPYFHTLILKSDFIVVHEITNGPFVPGGTLFADFSPQENDLEGVKKFQAALFNRLSEASYEF